MARHYARLVLDIYREICALPMLHICPKKGENDRMPGIHGVGGQVCNVNAEAGFFGRQVIRCLPAIIAPMHYCRRLNCDPQNVPFGHDPALVVESPLPMSSFALFNPIALDRLWRLIKYLAILERTYQLD